MGISVRLRVAAAPAPSSPPSLRTPTPPTDYYAIADVADATYGADAATQLKIMMFAPTPGALPRPRRPAGDILRLHRAKVGTYVDKGSGSSRRNIVASVGAPGTNRPTSWVLYDGTPGGDPQPYATSSDTFTYMTVVEPLIVEAMRETAAEILSAGAPMRLATKIAHFGRLLQLGTAPHTADLPCVKASGRGSGGRGRRGWAAQGRHSCRSSTPPSHRLPPTTLPPWQVLAVNADAGVVWVWDGTDASPWAPGTTLAGVRPRADAQGARDAGALEACSLVDREDGMAATVAARLALRPLPAGTTPPPVGTPLPVVAMLPLGAPPRDLPGAGEWIFWKKLCGAVVDGQLQARKERRVRVGGVPGGA